MKNYLEVYENGSGYIDECKVLTLAEIVLIAKDNNKDADYLYYESTTMDDIEEAKAECKYCINAPELKKVLKIYDIIDIYNYHPDQIDDEDNIETIREDVEDIKEIQRQLKLKCIELEEVLNEDALDTINKMKEI